MTIREKYQQLRDQVNNQLAECPDKIFVDDVSTIEDIYALNLIELDFEDSEAFLISKEQNILRIYAPTISNNPIILNIYNDYIDLENKFNIIEQLQALPDVENSSRLYYVATNETNVEFAYVRASSIEEAKDIANNNYDEIEWRNTQNSETTYFVREATEDETKYRKIFSPSESLCCGADIEVSYEDTADGAFGEVNVCGECGETV